MFGGMGLVSRCRHSKHHGAMANEGLLWTPFPGTKLRRKVKHQMASTSYGACSPARLWLWLVEALGLKLCGHMPRRGPDERILCTHEP